MKAISIFVASVGIAALAGCQAETANDNTGDTLQANTLIVDNLDVATDNMSDMNAMSDMNMTVDNTTTVNTTTNTTTNAY